MKIKILRQEQICCRKFILADIWAKRGKDKALEKSERKIIMILQSPISQESLEG